MSEKPQRDLYTVIKIISNFLPDDEMGEKIRNELDGVMKDMVYLPPEARWRSWGAMMMCLERNLTDKFESDPVWARAIQSVCNDTKFGG